MPCSPFTTLAGQREVKSEERATVKEGTTVTFEAAFPTPAMRKARTAHNMSVCIVQAEDAIRGDLGGEL